MSTHMKKRPTKTLKLIAENGDIFEVPKSKVSEFKKFKVVNVPSKLAFADLNAKYSKPGAILKGLRLRENMNQTKFGKLFNITQGDLSKLEQGNLVLGRERAKKIAKKFDIDYRILL